jgi:bifunctional DNase/RNase
MVKALPLLASLLAVLLWTAACSEPGPSAGQVAVRVGAVAVDRDTRTPVVILEELAGPRRLPIWIGHAEATSIDSRLHERPAVRPNSHDLAKRLVEGLGGEVLRVVVTDLEDGIYYARIVLSRSGNTVEIDARPSDAIAIAMRTGAPLFVTEPLFLRALESDSDAGNAKRI